MGSSILPGTKGRAGAGVATGSASTWVSPLPPPFLAGLPGGCWPLVAAGTGVACTSPGVLSGTSGMGSSGCSWFFLRLGAMLLFHRHNQVLHDVIFAFR